MVRKTSIKVKSSNRFRMRLKCIVTHLDFRNRSNYPMTSQSNQTLALRYLAKQKRRLLAHLVVSYSPWCTEEDLNIAGKVETLRQQHRANKDTMEYYVGKWLI